MNRLRTTPGSRARALQSTPTDPTITHVSDTALWVATFRAAEGQRADAAFADPLASILAGDRGRAIARAMPRAAIVEWAMVIRTSAIDRLIHAALDGGVDTVLNLGAGLDTRPYRMPLPASLRWVEVDFPAIVDLKNSVLAGHQPRCRVERVAANLLNRPCRNELLARCALDSKATLVITEGVLSYFSVPDVATLAGDLLAVPSIRYWIQDFDNAGQRGLPRAWARKLRAAPLLFTVKDWFKFFEKYGWQFSRVITSYEEAQRIGRPYPLDFPRGLVMRALPGEMRQKILSMSGVVMMHGASHGKDALPQ